MVLELTTCLLGRLGQTLMRITEQRLEAFGVRELATSPQLAEVAAIARR